MLGCQAMGHDFDLSSWACQDGLHWAAFSSWAISALHFIDALVRCGLMVIAVGFLIHWLERTQDQTLVLELNWSELEVVVAGEGGHCVGRGPPSCLVCATAYPSQTPPGWLDSRDLAEDALQQWIHLEKKQPLSTFDCTYVSDCKPHLNACLWQMVAV